MSVEAKIQVHEAAVARIGVAVARIDSLFRPRPVDVAFRMFLVRSRAAHRGHITRLLPKIRVPPAKLPPIKIPPPIEKVWRSFVSGLIYCGGKAKVIGVGTFTSADVDLEEELFKSLIAEVERLSDACSPLRKYYGYEHSLVEYDKRQEAYFWRMYFTSGV